MKWSIKRANISNELISVWGLSLCLYLWIVFRYDGLGDDGDSVSHYFISRYSWIHPHLFFDHWGKPFFTLISSPFAQFGFKGLQIFNIILLLCTQLALYKIAFDVHWKFPWMAACLLPILPMSLSNTPTGLTEPLFNCMVCWAGWFFMKRNLTASMLVLSFLPLVRSEGLLVLGFILLLLLFRGMWKWIPLLAAGHLIYGILGSTYHKDDVFWVIRDIPYHHQSSIYGKGYALHFIYKSLETLTEPGSILLLFGIVAFLFFGKRIYKSSRETFDILLYSTCIILLFYFFHSYAWASGKFQSAGLTRVMMGISGLAVLLMHFGIHKLQERFTSDRLNAFWYYIPLIFISFAFIIHPKITTSTLSASLHQECCQIVTHEIKKEFPDYQNRQIFCSSPLIHFYLDLDPFGPMTGELSRVRERRRKFPRGNLLIWDSYYSGFHSGIPHSELDQDSRYRFVKVMDCDIAQPEHLSFRIYEIDNAAAIDYGSKTVLDTLDQLSRDIMMNAEMMVQFRQQARFHRISLDSSIRMNARYLMEVR